MLVAYFFLLLSFFFAPPYKLIREGFNEKYISQEGTLPIKGLFTFIVLCSHSRDYIVLSNSFMDQSFKTLTNMIGQLMVTLFFFYSGFGIYESVKRKGKKYIHTFPKRRLFTTWLSFAIAVLMYLVFGLLRKKVLNIRTVLLALIGWESVGNSCWFMFVTFMLYLLFFLSFSFEGGYVRSLTLFSAFSLFLFFFLYHTKEVSWYNTLFCMPAGMWFSQYREEIELYLSKKNNYLKVLLSSTFIFLCCYYFYYTLKKQYFVSSAFWPMFYNIFAVIFCFIIVLLSMKIQVRSYFCAFLGKHVFSIYILQRLCFALLKPVIDNSYVLFITGAIFTIISALLFDHLFLNLKRNILIR